MSEIEADIREFATYLDGPWLTETQEKTVYWGAPHAWFGAMGADGILSWASELRVQKLRTEILNSHLKTVLGYLEECIEVSALNSDGGQEKSHALEVIIEARDAVELWLDPQEVS